MGPRGPLGLEKKLTTVVKYVYSPLVIDGGERERERERERNEGMRGNKEGRTSEQLRVS